MGSEYINYGKSKGLDLESCSSEKLLTDGVKYDLIILHHVLEHFVDIKKELSIIRQLMSDEGLFYISVPGMKNLQHTLLDYLHYAHVRYFSRDTLKQLMSWNGFEEVSGNEEIKSLYKKGEFNSNVQSYSDDIINYLKNHEEEMFSKTYYLNSWLQERKNNWRSRRNIDILKLWVKFQRNGGSLTNYLENRGIENIAIYGFGVLGELLYDELSQSNKIKVLYIIDKKHIEIEEVKTYEPSADLPKVDLILIATAGDYYDIKQSLGSKNAVVTIRDIMDSSLFGDS